MYYASLEGQIVRAGDPEYNFRRWPISGRLKCPTCNAAVVFASGPYQSPHFRHKAGLGQLECENFHPSLHIPSPQPLQPEPWQKKHYDDNPLPSPVRREDTWILDLQLRVDFKERSKASFVFELRARNFAESTSIEIVSIHGGTRTLSFGKETKNIAMLVDPFKPFIKVISEDPSVISATNKFCSFFTEHRYFIISRNLMLHIDEEFDIGGIKAIYDSNNEQILSDLNAVEIFHLLIGDNYKQSLENSSVKISSPDCIGLNVDNRCIFLTSFENVFASNESDLETMVYVKAFMEDGVEIFDGFIELKQGRQAITLPDKDRAVSYLIKSNEYITQLELQDVKTKSPTKIWEIINLGDTRNFIVSEENSSQIICWNEQSWVCREFSGAENSSFHARRFPVSMKEWNLEVLGIDFK